jgi:uncharacterized protein (DUF1015 family)
MDIQPFRGLRPNEDLASKIPSPPYDVLSTEEARRAAAGNPHSFLHVIKPEIDLDPGIDPHDPQVYRTGGENLRAMVDAGWLLRDERPAYYVYRLVMDGQAQVGILGAAAIEDYRQGRIRKHEHTRPEKEDDRVRLNTALAAYPGPVFLTHRPLPELDAVVAGILAAPARVRFTSDDGIEHALWVVDDDVTCKRIAELFAGMDCTYVADGHHRAAAAARVADASKSAGHFLAAHFPSDQLRVLDYNRVVRDLHGLDLTTLLGRIEEAGFRIEADYAERSPTRRTTFGMFVQGRWYRLDAKPEILADDTDVVGRLDVSLLTDRLLQPILGIDDPRTDSRIDFIGGIRGMGRLEEVVNNGEFAIAFSLFPTSLDEVLAVADAGLVMPPKSTWFEPKLRSGMVVQTI